MLDREAQIGEGNSSSDKIRIEDGFILDTLQ
mgnify:CR=1 FL=1